MVRLLALRHPVRERVLVESVETMTLQIRDEVDLQAQLTNILGAIYALADQIQKLDEKIGKMKMQQWIPTPQVMR